MNPSSQRSGADNDAGGRRRIGLVVDGSDLPVWTHRVLELLDEGGTGEVVLVIRVPATPSTTFDRVIDAEGQLLGLPRAPGHVLEDLPVLDGSRVVQLTAYQPDVLLYCGRGKPPASLGVAAPLGLWSIHLGQPDVLHLVPGEEEVATGQGVIRVALRCWRTPTQWVDVIEGAVRADPLSLARTQRVAQLRGAGYVVEQLRRAQLAPIDSLPATPPLQVERPKSPAVAAYLARTALRLARRACTKRRWFVAWQRDPMRFASYTGVVGKHGLERFPPGDRQLADPFPVRTETRETHVFVEEIRRDTGRGVISVFEPEHPESLRCVLEEPFHLSWPAVLYHEGTWWMTPETADAGEVILYRSEAFPEHWVRHATLIEGVRAADPTIFEYDGRWWMFVTQDPSGAGLEDQLHLYLAERLEGPWQEHPASPVVRDVQRARPAGRVFRQGDALIRPAQDCSREYGYAIRLMRIDLLTCEAYRETEVGFIGPEWERGLAGTHTINAADGIEVLDGLRVDPRLGWTRKA